MKYQLKEVINEKYSKAVNILKDNLKENYHVFYGLRLSEVFFPTSEYGSDVFFRDFERINSITLPLVVFDLLLNKPVVVIGFDIDDKYEVLTENDLPFIYCTSLSDLLSNSTLISFYKE